MFPAMGRLKPTFQSPTLAPALFFATTIRSAAVLSSVKEGEHVISTRNANQPKLCTKIKSSVVKTCFHLVFHLLLFHLLACCFITYTEGTILWTILDEFSENFQTASDPPPPPSFRKTMLRFFATNFSDWSDPPPFSRKFIVFPPQNYRKNRNEIGSFPKIHPK